MKIKIQDDNFNFDVKKSKVYCKLLTAIMNENDVTWKQAVDILTIMRLGLIP